MASSIGNHKLAERLFLLNDRQLGVLTRLHHMKQLLSTPDHRPTILPGGDKLFEPAWKALLKKFPSFELKSGQSNIQPFITHQKELFGPLSSYYYNYVDVLDVRDNVLDILARIGCAHIQFDITINSDLTRLFLDLIANYFAMMFLLTRLPDTKALLALFNFLYDQTHGRSEPNFPRMAEMFTETPEGMLKLMHADINPYSRILLKALNSLNEFFLRRTVRAQNWSDGNFLSLLKESNDISHTVLGDQLACELLSYEMMERWIIFGYLLIYKDLSDEDAFSRLKTALRQSYVVVLFRDEVIYIHALVQSFLESVWTNKVGNKRISEVKETLTVACTQTFEIHSDRRDYLRSALRQLHLILSDEPGLLGPKAFLVFWGLSYAADEVHWLLRHIANPPVKKVSNHPVEEYADAYIAEFLFYLEELRVLVIRYTSVIQRFYVQLLRCYDAPGLVKYSGDMLPHLSPENATILSDITKQLSDLGDHDALVNPNKLTNDVLKMFDFSGIRLDWIRLQASLSSTDGNATVLSEHRRLVEHFHSTVLHTKFVDYLDELLRFVSDMSILSFYPVQFVDFFRQCLLCPSQLRFAAVFPGICCYGVGACHDLCPEERPFLGRSAIRRAYHFCQNISNQLCDDVLTRIDEFGALADQLSPQQAVALLPAQKQPKRKNKKQSAYRGDATAHDFSKGKPVAPSSTSKGGSDGISGNVISLPGSESFRHTREEQTPADITLFRLTLLCQAINHHRELKVYDQIIIPRELFQNELQSRLIELLGGYAEPSPVGPDPLNEPIITRPSELHRRIVAVMDVLLDLEHHVCIDVVGLITTVFTQHTQPQDGFKGELTMTAHYTKWYIEYLLKHAYMDHFVYSPLLKCFVTLASPELVRFRAEDFADLNELRALAELIGPLGIKYLVDQLMQTVGDRVDEIKRLVVQNRITLESLRECFDDPVKTKQLSNSLQNSDALLTLLKEIGIALAFRRLCAEALNDVLKRRTPFLLSSLKNLRSHVIHQSGGKLLPQANSATSPTTPTSGGRDEMEMIYARLNSQLLLNNLSSNMGILSDLDYNLCAILNSRRQNIFSSNAPTANTAGINLDYHIACLFIVFVANALPRLARQDNSIYLINLDANQNNCHCIAYSVNALMVAMFSLLRPGDLEARSKEFLALTSSNLLRLGLETSTSILSEVSGQAPSGQSSSSGSVALLCAKNRDSIYILFDNLIRNSPYLSHSLQEACFPYSLIRSAYHNVSKISTSNLCPRSKANAMSSSVHVES